MHPAAQGNVAQSLAEATVPVGGETVLHRHGQSEELYHILQGQGLLTLGAETLTLIPGDTVCIVRGTPHRIRNTGGEDLRLLCCCTPPYAHDDTELLG